jgi:hypothetical protein
VTPPFHRGVCALWRITIDHDAVGPRKLRDPPSVGDSRCLPCPSVELEIGHLHRQVGDRHCRVPVLANAGPDGRECNTVESSTIPVRRRSISLIVASLADPFNGSRFWDEVHRTLKIGAYCIFTSPSYEWASSFRRKSTDEREGAALFKLRSGERIYLPSLVQPEASQIEMIRRAGLSLVVASSVTADSIPQPHSPKITGCRAIVSGFVVRRI